MITHRWGLIYQSYDEFVNHCFPIDGYTFVSLCLAYGAGQTTESIFEDYCPKCKAIVAAQKIEVQPRKTVWSR